MWSGKPAFACALLLAATACAESRAFQRDAGATSDAAIAADAGAGCGNLWHNDCPDGSVCYGSLECGSVWQCAEPRLNWPPACSAALPGMVCDCDGYVASRAAGCPQDRYSRPLQPQFRSLHAMLNQEGRMRCDPSREQIAMTYRVHGRGFEAYEGQAVHWSIVPAPSPELDGIQIARVQDGGFEASIGPVDAGEPHWLAYFIDSDGDGRCETDPDPTTPVVEPGGEPGGYHSELAFDLVEGTYDYTVMPVDAPAPGFCRRFDASN